MHDAQGRHGNRFSRAVEGYACAHRPAAEPGFCVPLPSRRRPHQIQPRHTERCACGFFTLMLYPPRELTGLKRHPLELVFVLDCSGSMSGAPLRHAKAAIERALQLLQPGDSFQLINFSMSSSQLGEAPLEATEENVQRGLAHLRSLRSGGGTMMIEGVKAALDFPHDPRGCGSFVS